MRQDSELGALTTTTEYLSGFRTRVTNPRGFQVVTSYLAYDQPTSDWPLAINAPDSASTTITRDVFGKPTAITRSGGGASAVRSYAYNAYQELCRSVEPETGATLFGYDAAGNLTSSAAGLDAGTACGASNSRTVSRSYDARNRLGTLAFPDGNGNQSWTYTPDGLPATVGTSNGGTTVTNTYSYNKRRLPTTETMSPDGVQTWSIAYGYNALGQRTSETDPGNVAVTYAVNALGQTTGITANINGGLSTPIASNASYFPNGALQQFTYGNNIVHTMTQNARQLPGRSKDGTVLDLTTTFGANGNVASVTDATAGGRQSRTLSYDGLDRLIGATSPMFGNAIYSYDALDNLARVQVTGGPQVRDHTYCYNAGTNRLDFVRTGPNCSTSPATIALAYDVQGNLSVKNGASYAFDYGNRLRSAAGLGYRYDAEGRRVRAGATQGKYSQYAKDGRLVWQVDELTGTRINNVYLSGSLVAEISRPIASESATYAYLHTDPLGSPIARTNLLGMVTQTSEFEPYGALLNRGNDDRAGYTGHVMDSQTGLTYMQQRYYDPTIGRFLSTDAVTAYDKPMTNFNPYAYANNNPYRFTDPDGRDSASCYGDGGCGGNNSFYASKAKIGMIADMLPGIGTIKGIVEAFQNPTPVTIGLAVIGVIPEGGGIAKTVLKEGGAVAKEAASAGKVASQIDRAAFAKERSAFWKQEASKNGSKYGSSDLARMEKGKPPIGSDGHPMELHHSDRTMGGGVEPMTRTDHRLGENYKKNHPDP